MQTPAKVQSNGAETERERHARSAFLSGHFGPCQSRGRAASAMHPAARGAPLKPNPLPQRGPRGCQGSAQGTLPASGSG